MKYLAIILFVAVYWWNLPNAMAAKPKGVLSEVCRAALTGAKPYLSALWSGYGDKGQLLLAISTRTYDTLTERVHDGPGMLTILDPQLYQIESIGLDLDPSVELKDMNGDRYKLEISGLEPTKIAFIDKKNPKKSRQLEDARSILGKHYFVATKFIGGPNQVVAVAYSKSYGKSALVFFDVKTGNTDKVVILNHTKKRAKSVAVNKDGGRLYIGYDHGLTTIDLNTLEVLGETQFPDGTDLYLSTKGRSRVRPEPAELQLEEPEAGTKKYAAKQMEILDIAYEKNDRRLYVVLDLEVEASEPGAVRVFPNAAVLVYE